MGLIETARGLWTIIRDEKIKRANTAVRVGNAGLALLDAIEAIGVGVDGKSVELQKTATYIQWRWVGDENWINLVALSDLVGANGDDGADGKSVELQKTSTYIQWRLVGDATWINLVALADLKGADGENGTSAPTTISIFKTGTGAALPQKFKWPSNITVTSVQLLSNCTEISVTIGSTTYNHTTLVGVMLAAGTELSINDITVANGQTNANALIIF